MQIQGIQKTTLLDYPNHIACTLFTYGCNLRCPFCHNADLVIHPPKQGIGREELIRFLQQRVNVTDGVCISGGEPLMQPDIAEFIKDIRKLGYKIKLDTNGFYPQKLQFLLNENLLDYVAIDIKSSKENYSAATGVNNIDISPLLQSIDIIRNSNVEYEFRTTAAKGLHNVLDFEKIGNWLKGAKRYYIQQFVNSGNIVGTTCQAFTAEEMRQLLKAVQKNIPHAEIKGM